MNRRAFLSLLGAGFVAPFLPVPAHCPKYAAGTYGAIERAAFPFWRAELVPATGVVTLEALTEAWTAMLARDIENRAALVAYARAAGRY